MLPGEPNSNLFSGMGGGFGLPTPPPPFTATLPNGVTVELVGVCEHPSEGKQWWKPDGSLLSEAPYATTGNTERHEMEGYQNYEFALRLRPANASYTWLIPGGSFGSDTGSPSDQNGRPIRDLKSYQTGFIRDKETSTIRVGVTASEWKTVATQKSDNREQTLTVGDYSIAFGVPYEKDNETLLPVVHTYNRGDIIYAIRVVAVTVSGRIQESGYSGQGGNKLDNLTYSFHKLPLNEITEFQFQIRPYEWVEFKNVSLKPNYKTDVKIETPYEFDWNAAFNKAIDVIQTRENWPQTPEAVCRAFWDARARKDYNEMQILWPGSASWYQSGKGWKEICENDLPCEYIFGTPSEDGTRVPYASKEYFNKNDFYNLTMKLGYIETETGRRFYVMSGN